jgi:SAM-dependent methyltransferase
MQGPTDQFPDDKRQPCEEGTGRLPVRERGHLLQQLAASLDATPEILPQIPYLLADLQQLGSHPEIIADLLRPFCLPRATTVLDLGCGKGAVSLFLARELQFQILGVDLFEPFIEEARAKGEEEGLDDLCRFEVADMRDVLHRFSEVDVVIVASIGSVLGDLETCVARLRGAVRSKGFIVIEDGFLTGDEPIERRGYEYYVPHREALRQLTAFGDTLEAEILIPAEALQSENRHNTQLIRRRAEQLARTRPELAASLDAYVRNQEIECDILETRTTGAVWLLRRR